jgi:hypothetical protein
MRAESIVAHLVIDRERPVWTRAEIENELRDLSKQEIGEALKSLEGEGVLVTVDKLVSASRCAKRLDRLEMLIPWVWG